MLGPAGDLGPRGGMVIVAGQRREIVERDTGLDRRCTALLHG